MKKRNRSQNRQLEKLPGTMKEGRIYTPSHTPPLKSFPYSALIVFDHLRQGLSPARLWKEKRLTKGQVDYVLKMLQDGGFIEKISYSVWKVLVDKLPEKRRQEKVIKTWGVAMPHTPIEGRKSDSVRGHGMVMTLSIPKLDNWERRQEIMSRIDPKTEKPIMEFVKIPQGQRIIFQGCKTWLCDDSIVIYFSKETSWFAMSAPDAARSVVYDTISMVKHLEKALHIGEPGFRKGKGYKIKFSRNHYSLIKNALAMQYKKDERKLSVYDDDGELWLIIDNSFNFHELETLHPITSKDDNVKVQTFFNGVKRTGITPEMILEGMKIFQDEMVANRHDLVEYGREISTHKESIRQLCHGIEKFTQVAERLEKILSSMNGKS